MQLASNLQHTRVRIWRLVGAAITALALVVALQPGTALAASGDTFYPRITCSGQYQAVFIHSTGAENWVDYDWDSGDTRKWNPYGNYWGYQTADTSTWAIVGWDHTAPSSSGRYCKTFT